METDVIEAPVETTPAPVPPQAEPEISTIEFSRPQLYPEQEAAIFAPERYSLIESTTKGGKTSGCLIWIAEKAITGQHGWHYWWVAPVLAQARMAFRRLKGSLNPDSFRANETELTITFLATRTTIDFKGADHPDSLYGEDVQACVIDEASRVKEDAWHAIRTTLTATRGPVRIIGNVKGRKNWFYKFCRRAAAGEADTAFHRITHQHAVAAGVLDAAEIEDARAKLPAPIFKQLYDAEAADDEGNPFGILQLKALYRPSLSSFEPVCWGWDFAKSHDWTVGIGLDRYGSMCRLARFQKPWNETKSEVRKQTGNLPAMGDSTGVGDPIVEDLQRKFGVNIEGYIYSSGSKQRLMEGLAADIQQGGWGIMEGVVTEELESFEYVYTRSGVTYAAPEGMFDDCVNALALARILWRRGGYGEPFHYTSARVAPAQDDTTNRGDIWRRNSSPLLVD